MVALASSCHRFTFTVPKGGPLLWRMNSFVGLLASWPGFESSIPRSSVMWSQVLIPFGHGAAQARGQNCAVVCAIHTGSDQHKVQQRLYCFKMWTSRWSVKDMWFMPTFRTSLTPGPGCKCDWSSKAEIASSIWPGSKRLLWDYTVFSDIYKNCTYNYRKQCCIAIRLL